MSNFLAKQESVLPLGYKLQLIWNDGKPETVPIGTSRLGQLEMQYGALQIRERIARELGLLFMQEFGYGFDDFMTLCANDKDGNEGVWLRAKMKPRNNWHEQLQTKQPVAALEVGDSDAIDV